MTLSFFLIVFSLYLAVTMSICLWSQNFYREKSILADNFRKNYAKKLRIVNRWHHLIEVANFKKIEPISSESSQTDESETCSTTSTCGNL